MELTLEQGSGLHIQSYTLKSICIADHHYTQSFILSPTAIIATLSATSIEQITKDDLNKIIELTPEIVLIGCEKKLSFSHDAFKHFFYQHHIGLEIMNIGSACRTYNILMAENRRIVAMFILG